MRLLHGARVKRPDLVVVQIGGHEALGGVLGFDHAHIIGGNIVITHPLEIGAGIVPHRGHEVSGVAKQPQVIGDVAAAAAELPAHLRHQERHIQHVNLVGKNVVPEAILEHHDGVEGHRAADQCVLTQTHLLGAPAGLWTDRPAAGGRRHPGPARL
jgi:hypothetical protein